MEANLPDSFDTIKILLSTLGFPLYEKVDKSLINEKELLFINGRGIKAEGDLIDDGFVVFKGSQAKKDTVPSCHQYLITLRQNLISSEILVDKGSHYQFEKIIFSIPQVPQEE